MHSAMFAAHILTLVLTVGLIISADIYGMSWIRGKREVLASTRLHSLHRLVGFGLTLMILSGLYLASDQMGYLLTEPLFQLKLLFVAMLVVNSFVIGRLMRHAIDSPFATLPTSTRIKLYVSASVSSIAWIGALAAAVLLF